MRPIYRAGRWAVVPADEDQAVLVGPDGTRRHYARPSSARRAARLLNADDLRLQQAADQAADQTADDVGYDEDTPETAAIVRRWAQRRRDRRRVRIA